MSLNFIPLNTTRVVDETLNLQDKRTYAVFDGGQEVTYQTFTAQGTNTSSINILCNPPSEKVIIHPVIWQQYKFTLSYTATNTDAVNRFVLDVNDAAKPLERPIADAPRQFPLAQVTNSLSMSVNNSSFNTDLNKYFNGFIRFSTEDDKRDRMYSMTASQLDQGLKYDDLFLTNRSPFAYYGDNVKEIPRASFTGFKILTNPVLVPAASGTATVELTISEPLMLSPFHFSKTGLTGISTMTYNLNFGDLQNRLVCRSPVNGGAVPPLPLTGLAVAVNEAKLLFKYITPKLLDKIPKQLSYPYNEVVMSIKTQGTALVAGATEQITMNALNLASVPKRIIVFAREQENDIQGIVNIGKTDTFNSRLDQISVSYGNKSGLLSSASPFDLYQMARSNGINMSWSEWRKEIGSVTAIEMGKDIGLSSLEAPGLLQNPQLSIQYNHTNISDRVITYSLYVCIVYEGTISIKDQSVIKQTGVLSQKDIVDSQLKEAVYVNPDERGDYFGGFILDIIRGIRKAAQIGAPIVKGVADVAEKIGLGRASLGDQRSQKQGGRIGGRFVSRSDLMRYMDAQ